MQFLSLGKVLGHQEKAINENQEKIAKEGTGKYEGTSRSVQTLQRWQKKMHSRPVEQHKGSRKRTRWKQKARIIIVWSDKERTDLRIYVGVMTWKHYPLQSLWIGVVDR